MKTQESGNLRKGGTVLAEKLIDNDFVMFDLLERWQMSWNRMTD